MSRHQNKSPDQEGLVRKRAHAIWEKEGRPHGREKEHWEKALHELGTEGEPENSVVLTKEKMKSPASSSNEKRKRPAQR
jgi:Protein of unknown function (DUF2934)